MFEALDANKDGEISEAELKKAVTALKKLDADSDGKITLAEASGPGGPGGMGDPSQMVERWMENDQNGDGKLTSDEVPEFMGRMLQNADENGDGALDKAELTKAAEGFRERFGGGRFGGGPGGGPGFGPGGGGPDPAQWAGQFDRNKDGKLTPDEVPRQVAEMLRASKADANGDGAVDADELRNAARNMQQQFNGGRGRGGYGNRGGYGDRGGRGDRPQRPESDQ
jgi:Ca2+-binding EF-hand superfamily protein